MTTKTKKIIHRLITKIEKFEIWWIIIYLILSILAIGLNIASVLVYKQTPKIIYGGLIIINVLSILLLIVYLLILWFIFKKEIYVNWMFWITIYLLLVQLIAFPTLWNNLIIHYSSYINSTKFKINLNKSLSCTIWFLLIFSVTNFINSIILVVYVYKKNSFIDKNSINN